LQNHRRTRLIIHGLCFPGSNSKCEKTLLSTLLTLISALSFLSEKFLLLFFNCVSLFLPALRRLLLPLILSYLCVIGGSSLSGNENYSPRPIARTVSFILGFGAVFIILSVIFSSTIILVSGLFRYINIISGLIVIVLGLNIILAAKSGSIPLAVLYLIFYTAGLGLPFLLASFFFDAFVIFSTKLRTFIPLIRLFGGIKFNKPNRAQGKQRNT